MFSYPKWKVCLVLAICLAGMVCAIPSLFPQAAAPLGLQNLRTINLGLDLRGGSHLLLEVDTDAYLRDQMEASLPEVRKALREGNIAYTGLGAEAESLRFTTIDLMERSNLEQIITAVDDRLTLQLNGKEARLTFHPTALTTLQRQLLEQSIEIVRRRVDQSGTKEPIIQRQGTNRIVLQVPGLDSPDALKRILGRTAKLTFHLVRDFTPTPGVPEPGTRILPMEDSARDAAYAIVERRALLGGDTLTDANPSYDQNGQPVVSFRLNPLGARKFGDVSTANVGKPFAIVLDGKVISAPVIREPILGGSGQISGSFDVTEANDLALLLRAGALPAPLKIIEERSVGPSLGSDSIAAGKLATGIAILMVIGFMVLSYNIFGVFAVIALSVNLTLLLAVMALLQATLTLPGIAGIVLTLGMAVDANVLIYERMREEARNGKHVIAALENGFDRAFSTIMDSNLTTLLAGALLYYFGSGTVKGFAVTLSIGIATSMFSAVLVTRLLIAWWSKLARPKTLPI
jgi:preprotein translocase subunit SecD